MKLTLSAINNKCVNQVRSKFDKSVMEKISRTKSRDGNRRAWRRMVQVGLIDR